MLKTEELRKICHARVGQCVQLPSATGGIEDEVFVVCALDAPGKVPGRPEQSHGLYDDQRKLFLTSLSTGRTRPMPHLSSRAKLLQEAARPRAATALLVPRSSAPEARITAQGVHGKVTTSDVDLSAPETVYALLKGLADEGLTITNVQWLTDVMQSEIQLAAWRVAVANGQTMLSYEEFSSMKAA